MMLVILVVLQAVSLAVFAADPGSAPPRGGLIEAFWANRRPGLFITFIALAGVGPILSLILWRLGGWRRWVMILMWIAFFLLPNPACMEKMNSVMHVLWEWKLSPMLHQS